VDVKRKILVVDDSRTTRLMMTQLINRTPDMIVIGEAADGQVAVRLAGELQPDAILMDVIMPHLDGLEATREIMQLHPTPIVLVSASYDSTEADVAFKAIKAGALTVLRKPGLGAQNDEITHLLSTLRAMSSVHVIHHRSQHTVPRPMPSVPVMMVERPQVVAIAASTGGPAALSEILSNLPAHFGLSVLIVQHITPDFIPSLVGWLNHMCKLPVQVAHHGEGLAPGVIYIAPGGAHLRVNAQHSFVMNTTPQTARFMPSCDILLESVARVYGNRAVGMVLTGMGDDGARGLLAMAQAGAFTIAQDESTSTVFGMPREAVRLGAARQVLPLSKIAPILTSLSKIGMKT
jgi:two-component system, chemotaxis family, protein-glutamate methylesterase/glutaminase